MEKISQRQERIMHMLAAQEELSIRELADNLGVSGWTVRRDLDNLVHFNLVQRTHGRARIAQTIDYASLVPSRSSDDQMSQIIEKRRIGLAAARLVRSGQRVVLSAGTTTTQVAQALRGRDNLTILTNGLNIAQVLAGERGLEVICTGGAAHSDHYTLIGPIAEHTLKAYYYDLAIIGVNGITIDAGITANSPLNVATVNIMIEHSATVVMVADHTKFGRRYFAHVAPLSAVNIVVTDKLLAAEYVEYFSFHNVELIIADRFGDNHIRAK